MIRMIIDWPELAVFLAFMLVFIWIVKGGRCQHTWRQVEIIRVTDDGYTVGHKHVMRCDKCGWKKVVKI